MSILGLIIGPKVWDVHRKVEETNRPVRGDGGIGSVRVTGLSHPSSLRTNGTYTMDPSGSIINKQQIPMVSTASTAKLSSLESVTELPEESAMRIGNSVIEEEESSSEVVAVPTEEKGTSEAVPPNQEADDQRPSPAVDDDNGSSPPTDEKDTTRISEPDA